ncbi:MAG: hypothetical protein ACO3T8_05250, partial [Candidatus Nanopelagicales bacterium]
MQPIPIDVKQTKPLILQAGFNQDFLELIKTLVLLGYERSELVQSRGEFAVRGGIIDLFLPYLPHPIRIEFFSDEIEEIRTFSVSDQRTIE